MSVGAIIGSILANVLPALIAGGASLIENKANIDLTNDTNAANRDYADTQTTAQWERDDTSFRRQVIDAQAAGLSPLAVTGYAPSSTPVTSFANAPQMDLSGLIGSMSQLGSDLSDTFNSAADRAESARQANQASADKAKQLHFDSVKAENDLFIAIKELEQSNLEAKDKSLQFAASLQYQYDVLNNEIEQANASTQLELTRDNAERVRRISETSFSYYKDVCSVIGVTPRTKNYSDYVEYVNALNSFTMSWNTSHPQSEEFAADTYSTGSSGGLSLGAFGASIGGSGNNTMSRDITRARTIQALPKDSSGNFIPFPLYTPDLDSMKSNADVSKSFKKSDYTSPW